MIGGVGEEIGAGLREEGCTATVAFREDDLVKEEDGRVGGRCGFALVDEFVETSFISYERVSGGSTLYTLSLP